MPKVLDALGQPKVSQADFIPSVPAATIRQAAAQGITNNWTKVTGLSVVEDDSDKMTLTADQLTIRTAGRYMVTGGVSAAVAGAWIYPRLKINGAVKAMGGAGGSGSNDNNAHGGTVSSLLNLNPSDVIILEGYGDATGGRVTDPALTFLSAVYIGPGFNAIRQNKQIFYVTPAQFAALTPIDGDEAYLTVDAANGVIWHLRYNAGSGSVYKWEFLGGSPLAAVNDNLDNITTTGSFSDAGSVVGVTAPRAGQYNIEHGVELSTVGASCQAAIKVGGNAISDPQSTVWASTGSSGQENIHVSRLAPAINMPAALAGDLIKQQYSGNGTGPYARKRWIAITPQRIS